MTDESAPTADAVVEARRFRVSGIWVVPAVALILGIWLAVDAYLNQGPTVVIEFATAASVEADKTLVKARDVTIGTVTGVRLAEDLNSVLVTAELVPEARRLLREGTQFWVMRAEVQGATVRGLGTLLSGAYLEVAPGEGPLTGKRRFRGLDKPPVSPAGTPGMRFQLLGESTGSVSVGSPLLYRGYQVGRVEAIELDVERRRVLYSVFVDAPYDALVSSNTRFWNASGISAELSTEGVSVEVGSMQSLLVGGIAFDLPRNTPAGEAVDADTLFRLYPDEGSIHEDPYWHSREYVVFFNQSLRGLNGGAPVTYRGIRIGSVERVMLEDLGASEDTSNAGRPIPVLIRLEPGRLGLADSESGPSSSTSGEDPRCACRE